MRIHMEAELQQICCWLILNELVAFLDWLTVKARCNIRRVGGILEPGSDTCDGPEELLTAATGEVDACCARAFEQPVAGSPARIHGKRLAMHSQAVAE